MLALVYLRWVLIYFDFRDARRVGRGGLLGRDGVTHVLGSGRQSLSSCDEPSLVMFGHVIRGIEDKALSGLNNRTVIRIKFGKKANFKWGGVDLTYPCYCNI